MNDDVWSVLLAAIRSWWFGSGAAGAAHRQIPAPELGRRPLRFEAPTTSSRFRQGRRYYIDPPAAVQQADPAPGSLRGGHLRSNRAGGVDFKRSRSPRGEAARGRTTNRLAWLTQRFLAVRNRRSGPRVASAKGRCAYPSRTRAQHLSGHGFAESWAVGEAGSVEPP